MIRLSHKMKTAGKDYLGDNCKLFFPFDEITGTTFTDLAGSASFTGADIGFTVPHAVTMQTGTAPVELDSGTIDSVPDGKSVIMICCNIIDISSGQNTVQIGNTSAPETIGFGLSTQFTVNNGGTPVGAIFSATDTSGLSRLRAGTFNGVTGLVSAYSGIDGGAVALDNTANGLIHIGEFDLPNKVQVGSSATFVPDFFGLAFLVVDELPTEADLLEYLDVTYQNLINGHKYIDERLSNY